NPGPEPLLFAEESKLNEFPVLAFCAEITRLPGHCAPRSVPEKATAHTIPSRSTMVAHICRFNPLPSATTAVFSAAFSAEYAGRVLQPFDPLSSSSSSSAKALRPARRHRDTATTLTNIRTIFVGIILILLANSCSPFEKRADLGLRVRNLACGEASII